MPLPYLEGGLPSAQLKVVLGAPPAVSDLEARSSSSFCGVSVPCGSIAVRVSVGYDSTCQVFVFRVKVADCLGKIINILLLPWAITAPLM